MIKYVEKAVQLLKKLEQEREYWEIIQIPKGENEEANLPVKSAVENNQLFQYLKFTEELVKLSIRRFMGHPSKLLTFEASFNKL